MNLHWYYHRFKSMPFREIGYRSSKALRNRYAGFTYKKAIKQFKTESQKLRPETSSFSNVRFFGVMEQSLTSLSKLWVESTLQRADRYLAERYDCLAAKDIRMPEPFDWNFEPNQKIKLPVCSAFDFDYRDTRKYGDFKYFWEFGRWEHLVTLAKAYYITKQDQYAQRVESQIRGFLNQCPYLQGVHWTMAMESSQRLISLCWITKFMWQYLNEHPSLYEVLEEIVQCHLVFITGNYSKFSSGNNHYMSELCGVFLASLCFSRPGKYINYKKQAFETLCGEIDKQFYPDGVNKEQSSHYHISCLYCFLLAGLLGKDNGMPFPRPYWKRIENAADFVCAISDKNGQIPQIGDSDDGQTIHLTETNVSASQSLLSTCAVLFERGDFKAKTSCFDEMSFWLLGAEGMQKYEEISSDEQYRSSITYPHGGYYIVNTSHPVPIKLIVDCGPLGLGALSGHGHADALSFLLYVNNKEFLIDPGTYIYHAGSPFRDYFRGTTAHNTVCIDKQDQSEILGPFLWGRKANSGVDAWSETPDYVHFKGHHDGYLHLADPVLHQRDIRIDKKANNISIADRLECKSEHLAQLCFHFSEDCHTESESPSVLKVSNAEQSIEIQFDPRLKVHCFRGHEDSLLGWRSRFYDRKNPVYSIVAESTIVGTTELKTSITII